MSRRSTMTRRGGMLILGGVLAASVTETAAAEGPAGPSTSTDALVDADSARFRAMVDCDLHALERSLADELVYVHSSSTRQTKAEHLSDVRDGRAVYLNIAIIRQEPRIYGNVGVIHGVAAFVTGGARASTFRLRYTDVYVHRNGRWQMVAFACSRIPEATPT